MILKLIDLVSEYQLAVIIAFTSMIFLALIGLEFKIRAAKKARAARREAKRQKRFRDTSDSIRIKVRSAEKRRKENKSMPAGLSGITVEELDEAAVRRTLEDLHREGKSCYDADKTIRIYYPDKFNPSELGKDKA